MINLTIDDKAISVPKGTTVYHACKQMGIEIPIFCYLDRLPPFGACRVCLVEVEKMAKPQTSCTLAAAEGMVVKTQSKMAEEGRKSIIEFLLLNHPLDCPICDRGGECPLQDNAMKYGPGMSRFFEEKRKFKKHLPLGPVLMLDRERCIVCARCTRFGDELAGDHALEFVERGYKTEVGTPGGAPAESKFIGNTIMICPVGALTSQVYRFRARPWDNDSTPSSCTLCPVGCSMILDARDGQIMRTRSEENRAVNDIWLCDKGWFGYEFTYHPDRLTQPLIRRGGELKPATWEEALSLVSSAIQSAKPQGKLAAFGGNPLTFEENYLFQKLMREGAGVHHVDHQIGIPDGGEEEGAGPGMEISIGKCEELSFIILLGLDLTEEFPVIWLRLRQAINKGAKVIFLGHFAPEIAPYLTECILHPPGEELEMLQKHLPRFGEQVGQEKKGALFVGRQYLANPERGSILSELLKFREGSPRLSLNIMEGSGNSMGARMAGMRPGFGLFGTPVDQVGMRALHVLEKTAGEGWDFLYVAGANPALQFPPKLWNEARAKLGMLVVQDLFLTETAQQADVVLPVLTFIEKGGSFINIEGRVQSLLPGKEVPENLKSDGEIFMEIAQKLNIRLELDPSFAEKLKPGTLLPLQRAQRLKEGSMVQKRGFTGEGYLKASFSRVLFDQGVRMKHDPHLSQLVKEPRCRLSPQEGIKRGLKYGDLVSLRTNEAQIKAQVTLDEGVAPGTIVLPLGFEREVGLHQLNVQLMNGIEVEVAKL